MLWTFLTLKEIQTLLWSHGLFTFLLFVYIICYLFTLFVLRFVKVPKSLETFTLDQMEIFMYDYLHPLLQTFASNACGDPNAIQMPIPLSKFHIFRRNICYYCENISLTLKI